MLVISIADVPAKLLVWKGWYVRFAPYLHTMTARWVLGVLGILITLVPWIADWAKSWQIIPRKPNSEVSEITSEKRELGLGLIPHGDNSSEVYLEVINNSETTQMSAQIGVLSRSYGDGVKKYRYTGIWSGPIFAMENWNEVQPVRDHGKRTSVVITSGKSHLLRIASVELNDDYGQCTLSLVGLEEKLMWDFEPSPKNHLPFFVVQVQLFGEGFVSPPPKNYRVGPKASIGPMDMVEVPA